MTDSKTFELGLIVGRFQTLHTGHQYMIETALSLCGRVAVFIGSAQEQGTAKNPFSYELRKDILQDVFGDRLEIYPLLDIGVGNSAKWGEYVLDNVRERCGRLPDIMISGKEDRRTDWFEGINGLHIAELFIPKTIEISASAMRQFFIEDDFESWKKYVDPALLPRYRQLRQITVEAQKNTDTKSI